MAPKDIYLGVALSDQGVRVVSSLGQRSAITSERLRDPEDWVELATYGVPLPEDHRLLACVAVPSGYPSSGRDEILKAVRGAGWDAAMIVNAVHAAGRGVARGRRPAGDMAVVVVDGVVSSVGIVRGEPLGLMEHDSVHRIAGREAREVAVSLRCMLKPRGREEVRALLKNVVVAGEMGEVDRVGRRLFERELEGLGAGHVTFELDPFLLAQGALRIAKEARGQTWRRIRRRWR